MRRPGLFILTIILLALLIRYSSNIVDFVEDIDYSEYYGLTGCTGYGMTGHRFGGGSSRGAGNGGRY